MTKDREKLLQIFLDENKAARLKGDPYLKSQKTIEALAERTPEEAVGLFVRLYHDGSIDKDYKAAENEEREHPIKDEMGFTISGERNDRITYLLWYLYMRTGGALTLGRAWWDFFAIDILQDLYVAPTPFYPVAQTAFTNALARVFDVGLQRTVGDGRILQVTVGGTPYEYTLAHADQHKWHPVRLNKLRDALLREFLVSGPNVSIPVEEYAELIGRDISKRGARKRFCEDLRADLATLADIAFMKGDDRIGLGGNVHLVTRDGIICWEWGSLVSAYFRKGVREMDISAETFKAEGPAYHISRYIDVNWRINEGRDRVRKIMLSTLVEVSGLPKISDMREQRISKKRMRERTIIPIFEALDSFDRFGYDVYTKDGVRIDDPLEMTIEQFEGGYILVDYSEYPQHPDRIKNRAKYTRIAKKKKEKSKKTKAEEKPAEN